MDAADRFAKVFTLSPVAMSIATLEGTVIDVNEAMQRLFGYQREELIGRTGAELGIASQEARAAVVSKLKTDGRVQGIEVLFHTRGGDRYIAVWMDFIELDQGRCLLTGQLDVTDRVLAERGLAKANEVLAEAVRAAGEANEALKRAQADLVQQEKLASLGRLVAGVAHEINNPLAFVTNNLAVLERDLGAVVEYVSAVRGEEERLAGALPELAARLRAIDDEADLGFILGAWREYVARTREGVSRIHRIVRDLSDFARLSESDFAVADLNQGVVSTVNIVRGKAVDAGVEVALDLGPLEPLLCQPRKINQVVMNLVANAIDACARSGHVTVRTRPEGQGGARIEVMDDGAGIDPAVLARVFDPFFTTKPVGMGMGLGLAISYGIVREHGGQIDVTSTPGEGSTFTVTLPAQRSPG